MKHFLKLFHWERAVEPVFIVSGLPRSGTSLMMMMLEAVGILPLTDRERSPDPDNPRGYYEFERVKKLKDGDLDWMKNAPGKAVKVISVLLQYLPQDYRYKVLFMRRELSEILASQRKMLINRGEDPNKISDQEMAEYFEKHLNQVIAWLENQPNFSTLYVDYNLLVSNPGSQINEIAQFLGGGFDVDRLISAVDPNLYRQRVRSGN